MVKATRRNLKWFDSLLWLAIAGVLATLLVPGSRQQKVCKHVSAAKTSLATNLDDTSHDSKPAEPSPYVTNDAVQYSPPGPEFILQNEADFIEAREESPANLTTPEVSGPVLAPPR